MPEATITTSSKPSAWSSFFGNVKGTIEQTVAEVLPNWTKQQLLQQSTDQLERTTFDQTQAAPRVDAVQTGSPTQQGAMSVQAFSIGGFSITYGMLVIGFSAMLAVGLILRGR